MNSLRSMPSSAVAEQGWLAERRIESSSRPLILVGGEDAEQLALLEYILELEGFLTLRATEGAGVLNASAEHMPQLALLDVALPPTSGMAVCQQLRLGVHTRTIPIIMMAGDGAESDHVDALRSGANDCVAKPIAPANLVARIRAVLRRANSGTADSKLRFADIEMDLITYRVHRNGHEVKLAPTEFRLLRHLLRYPGEVFSRDQLFDAAWTRKVNVGPRTVDVHMGRLRRALTAAGTTDPIRTVRSVGYALSE